MVHLGHGYVEREEEEKVDRFLGRLLEGEGGLRVELMGRFTFTMAGSPIWACEKGFHYGVYPRPCRRA